MNMITNATQRLEKEIANAGDPPHCDYVPPLDEDAIMEQAPTNHPLLMDEIIRTDLIWPKLSPLKHKHP